MFCRALAAALCPFIRLRCAECFESEASLAAKLSVSGIFPELVRDGTKMRVGINIINETTGDGGNLTVWIPPTDSIEEASKLALNAMKVFLADAVEG